MNNTKNYYWINNTLCDSAVVTINPLHRSVRLSDGVFESILVVNGRIPLLDLHFQRLNRGITVMQFSRSENALQTANGILHWTTAHLADYIQCLLKINQLSTARIRIQISRDADGLYLPDSNRVAVIISANPTEPDLCRSIEAGFSTYTVCSSMLQNCKTTNSIVYTLAAIEDHRMNRQQGILCNTDGMVADATSANVFWIKNGETFTPPLWCGGIAGVLRSYLLQTENITEKTATPDELLQADEIFFTNAVQGIICAAKLEGKVRCSTQSRILQAKVAAWLMRDG